MRGRRGGRSLCYIIFLTFPPTQPFDTSIVVHFWNQSKTVHTQEAAKGGAYVDHAKDETI